jgi:hypothetical protein
MPMARRQSMVRRGWTDAHFMQLAGGDDFAGDGWGALWSLSMADLRRAVEEMAQCYRDYRDAVQACLPRVGRVDTPWFEKYANDPERLLAAHQPSKASAA